MIVYFLVLFFFFNQKTAYEMRISDLSSDVCSSDLYFRNQMPAGIWLRKYACTDTVVMPSGAFCTRCLPVNMYIDMYMSWKRSPRNTEVFLSFSQNFVGCWPPNRM